MQVSPAQPCLEALNSVEYDRFRSMVASGGTSAAAGSGVAPMSIPNVWIVSAKGMADGAFPIDPISCDVATRVAMLAEMRKKDRRPILNVRKGLSTSARIDRYF